MLTLSNLKLLAKHSLSIPNNLIKQKIKQNIKFRYNLKKSCQLICGASVVVLLVGCGQKGDLYHPEEAPSNTVFILYGQNQTDKDDLTNGDNLQDKTQQDKTQQDKTQNKTELNSSETENDILSITDDINDY